MVKEIKHNKRAFYQCNKCKFYYKTKELAGKCQDFCKNNACSVEITKHAVQLD